MTLTVSYFFSSVDTIVNSCPVFLKSLTISSKTKTFNFSSKKGQFVEAIVMGDVKRYNKKAIFYNCLCFQWIMDHPSKQNFVNLKIRCFSIMAILSTRLLLSFVYFSHGFVMWDVRSFNSKWEWGNKMKCRNARGNKYKFEVRCYVFLAKSSFRDQINMPSFMP